MPRQPRQLSLPGIDRVCSSCGSEDLAKCRPVLIRPMGDQVMALRICPSCSAENWRHAFGRGSLETSR